MYELGWISGAFCLLLKAFIKGKSNFVEIKSEIIQKCFNLLYYLRFCAVSSPDCEAWA